MRYARRGADAEALNLGLLEEDVIICSCALISDRDIDVAVFEIMRAPNAVLPTPGAVYRHLCKKMVCGSCASLTVSVIYQAMDRLAADTRVNPFALAEARAKIARLEDRRAQRQRILALARQERQEQRRANVA